MKFEKYFREKMKLGKFSTESENFLELGKKSKTEGNATLPQRDGRLCLHYI